MRPKKGKNFKVIISCFFKGLKQIEQVESENHGPEKRESILMDL